eukprot:4348-Heterococcus_DN1.PRE.2
MSAECADVNDASPLDNAGILLHVFDILGPGHHLFVSAVSKAWRDTYKKIASVQVTGLTRVCYDDDALLFIVTSETTLFSAVFASVSRVTLAHVCGLTFDSEELQRIAGRAANIPILRAACELGLALTGEVLAGAAEAASVPTLQWLHTEEGCPLPPGICTYAARCGSIDT